MRTRTLLVNHVRGAVKSYGGRLKGTSAGSFHKKAVEDIPEHLRHILLPVVECIAEVTKRIREYDKVISIGTLDEQRFDEHLSQAEQQGLTPLEFLAHIVGDQANQRRERALERRIKEAFGFGQTPIKLRIRKRND